MRNNILKKGLVLEIILLFLGAGAVSAANFTITNNEIKNKNNIKETTLEKINYIGNVTIEYRWVRPIFHWNIVEDRNFTYPIEDGKVKVNYSFEFDGYSSSLYILPWTTFYLFTLWYKDDLQKVKLKWTVTPCGHITPHLKYIVMETEPIPPPAANESSYKAWIIPLTHKFLIPRFTFEDEVISFWASFI